MKEINLKSQSIRDVLRWLKENNYPDLCDEKVSPQEQYSCLISNYYPDAFELQSFGKKYNDIKQYEDMVYTHPFCSVYIIHIPKIDKYYIVSH